jgi:hypothetical protein
MSVKDYLAALKLEPGDKLDYGVRGMKWGIRRSSAQLRSAAQTRKVSEAKSPTDHLKKAAGQKPEAKKPGSNIQDHVESSPARYARLAQEAKAGKASQMSEQDLKFFNARTEALQKINKINEKKPGWLADTSKKVLQQTAQNSMQSIADGVAKKYISGPVIDAINKKS